MLNTIKLIEEFCNLVNDRVSSDTVTSIIQNFDNGTELLPWFGEISEIDGRTFMGVRAIGNNVSRFSRLENEEDFRILLSSGRIGQPRYLANSIFVSQEFDFNVNECLASGTIMLKLYAFNDKFDQVVQSLALSWVMDKANGSILLTVDSELDLLSIGAFCLRLSSHLRDGPYISSTLQDQHEAKEIKVEAYHV